MALFTALKSTQSLNPPDFFFTTIRLEIQCDAFTCSMVTIEHALQLVESQGRAAEGLYDWRHRWIYQGLVGKDLEATHTAEQRRPLLLPGDDNGVNL